MWRAFISMWKNVFNYTGKASRKEFWLGSIAEIVFMYLLLIPFAIVVLSLRYMGFEINFSPVIYGIIHIGVCIFPLLSLYVRRANDVGLKKFDTLLAAVAVPVAGAMIIGMYPAEAKLPYKEASWCYRCFAIGLGFFFYGGFIGGSVLGSFEAVAPFVCIGLFVCTITMITGAICAVADVKRKRNN